ncbi:TonB-dependent receptor [Aurantiacibacter gilvus]|uniref:TonB-dependent receptor n=1 Tax=Aurantiacibacter gilvus TaxID=3139141 RepID=A0ABU9IEY7_9SPHN
MHKFLATSSAIAIAMTAQSALAQETQDEEPQVRTSPALNTITVTAQRREESLQDAAIPVDVATGQEMQLAGVSDATALSKIAPSLTVTSGGGANPGYFIRGVGNFTNNGYTNPAVSFNIDGVYIGRSTSTVASFLDLNRVEVLKGPQGTLYGRNATGGAINVIPNRPELGELSGAVSLDIGNYDSVEISGMANIPIGDSVAVRLAAAHNAHDGYNSDGTNDADDIAFRGQLLAELGDTADIRFSVDYSEQNGVGPGITIVGNYNFLPPQVPGRNDLPVPGWAFSPAPANVSAPWTGVHAPQALAFSNTIAGAPLHSPYEGYAYPFRNDNYFGVSAELNVDLGGADLVVIPAYRRSELDNQFNGPPFKAAINQDEAEQYSLEARLSGETGPVDWIVGGFYFDEQVVGTNSFNQFATISHNTFDSQTESFAFFGRATLNLSDDFRLVGGLRWTDDSRSIDAFATATAAVCLEHPVGRPPNCSHVPTLPVGLTLQDTLDQIDPALFPAANPAVAFNPDGPDGVGQVFPYGPFNIFAPAQFGPGAIIAITPNTTRATDGDTELTYRIAAEYDVTPDNLLYVSFENGFRSGGFNLAFGRETYEPEFIDAFTLGSKNRFFDDRVELNIEMFYWEYSGQQLAALGVDANGNNAFYTRNVGASTIMGADIDFQVAATDTTFIRGSVQYLDATYDSFSFSQVDLSDPAEDPLNFLRPVTGCEATQVATGPTDPNRSFNVDCSGRDALNAPKWTASFGLTQEIDLGDFVLSGTVDGRYIASRQIGFNYIPLSRVDDNFTLDATLTLADIDEFWRITAYVRNITNEAVPSLNQTGSGNIVATTYQPPRTYGVRLGYQF